MDLNFIYDKIENIALSKVNVNGYYKGSPYVALQSKSVQYANVCYAIESVGQEDNIYTIHGILYFVDRLKQDGSNFIEVHNDAVNVISNIVRDIYNDEDVTDIRYEGDIELFSQRLVDYCGGGYVNIAIDIPVDTCEDYNE